MRNWRQAQGLYKRVYHDSVWRLPDGTQIHTVVDGGWYVRIYPYSHGAHKEREQLLTTATYEGSCPRRVWIRVQRLRNPDRWKFFSTPHYKQDVHLLPSLAPVLQKAFVEHFSRRKTGDLGGLGEF